LSAAHLDITGLITGDRIHGRLYYDKAIFEEEVEQIRNKVCLYIGHESEIPDRGDYLCRQVGRQPLLMVRGSDLKLRVFYNRCRHRANLLCNHDKDRATEFICPYHGWTYSIDGALVAPSFGKAYGSALGDEDFGLTAVEGLDTYRGL